MALGYAADYRKYSGGITTLVSILILSILFILLLIAATISGLLSATVGDFDPTGLTLVVTFLLAILFGLAAIVRVMVRVIVIDYLFRDRRYRGQIDLDNQEPAGSRMGVDITQEMALVHISMAVNTGKLTIGIIERRLGQSFNLTDNTAPRGPKD